MGESDQAAEERDSNPSPFVSGVHQVYPSYLILIGATDVGQLQRVALAPTPYFYGKNVGAALRGYPFLSISIIQSSMVARTGGDATEKADAVRQRGSHLSRTG